MQFISGDYTKVAVDPQVNAKRLLPLYALPLDAQERFRVDQANPDPPDLDKLDGT
jgi:hypothetical protein